VFGIFWLLVAPGLLNASSDNGFDLSNSEIPRARIEQGGPPRDGIPAINKPHFVSAVDAQAFLKATDRVLGVEIDGVARAYPVRILNYHEIVNDNFDGAGVLISYCPLCGTGMAFRSSADGRDYSFGVSGLLYNSDVLMYDRQTESLWSQILGRALSGSARGTELQSIPVIHTSWKEWSDMQPLSEVLSTQTGYLREYSRDPYPGYADSGRIWFSVANRDRRYSTKEWVIGLEVDGQTRAWPFSELDKLWKTEPHKAYLEDHIRGQRLRIYYQPESRSVRITDDQGRLLNGISAFWFAWIAFHPDTEVFSGR
jgi:hypothetical protein